MHILLIVVEHMRDKAKTRKMVVTYVVHLVRWLIIIATLALAGCVTVGPDYVKPELDVPANWNRLDQANSETKAAATGDLSRWWLALNDPLLSGLIDDALQASPDLRSAKARLREARARGAVASAGLYPAVTASGSARRNRSSEELGGGSTQNLFRAGFDAQWELDLFGGVRRGIESTRADVESSVASLENARVSLVAETAQNYVEVRTLQLRLGIARDNLVSQTATLQLTEHTRLHLPFTPQEVEDGAPEYEELSLPHTVTFTQGSDGAWLLSSGKADLQGGPTPTTQVSDVDVDAGADDGAGRPDEDEGSKGPGASTDPLPDREVDSLKAAASAGYNYNKTAALDNAARPPATSDIRRTKIGAGQFEQLVAAGVQTRTDVVPQAWRRERFLLSIVMQQTPSWRWSWNEWCAS